MKHTKILIMESLKTLFHEYSPIIQNYTYRGDMEKYPTFNMKQIAEKVGRTVGTVRKWCHVLNDEKKIKMFIGKCYFANSSETYQVFRSDLGMIKLRHKTSEERSVEEEEFLRKYS